MPDTITHEIPPASEAQAAGWTSAETLELVRAATSLRLPTKIVEDAHARGASVNATRQALLTAAADRSDAIQIRNHVTGGVDHSDPDQIRRRMAGAILNRVDPQKFPLAEEAYAFRGSTLIGLKRELLEARGIHTRGWTPDEIFQRGDVGGLHSSSDFAWLLGDVMRKTLEAHLADANSPLKNHSREKQAVDFREMIVARGGTASALEKINESGEFKRGTWQDEGEKFSISTYGKVFGVTRRVIIDDSLDFFSGIASEAALAVSALEADTFVNLLTANSGAGVTMGDNVTLFHSSHKNLGTASVPDIDALSEARQLLRAQRGAGGLHLIGATPAAIVVPSSLETVAEQLLASITPATVDDANPFTGRLAVEVDPRLDAFSTTRWYIFASAPAFVHAYLNGQKAADIATRIGFDVDGVEWRIRSDFGATALDYRLIVANAGAGG
jgi:hypothetical protein